MRPINWEDGILKLVDQTKLPVELVWVKCQNYKDVELAIKKMIVRGAPAIGVAAAYGMAMGARDIETEDKGLFIIQLEEIASILRETRPTAVNLFWAIERMLNKARSLSDLSIQQIKERSVEEAVSIDEEDIAANRAIAKHGNTLVNKGSRILTHCNAGALATSDYGTALGVIREAHYSGKEISVYADETRPFLQGSRLTAWELTHEGIPATLICDNMAGYVMKLGRVDMAIVGADRISANGDVANKIGTYSVAVLAKEHGIPFYVAAPFSTIDLSLKTGEEIKIEERSPQEITQFNGVRVAPEGINVFNPAFDVTPNKYVTAIITEKGIVYPPYEENLIKVLNEKNSE